MKIFYPRFLILIVFLITFQSCSKEDNSNSGIPSSNDSLGTDQNTSSSSSTDSSESNQENNSSNSNNSSESNQENSSSTHDYTDFDCDNWFYDLPRPEPVSVDNTHRYYTYSWQSGPMLCLNSYEPSILGERVEKVKDFLRWAEVNMPNIIPINVFYIDQINASDESKLQHTTDFCNLVREPNEVNTCINESNGSWGERSHGAGVYGSYLHKGADLMIYDDAFKHSGGVDEGMYYLNHEYFHTFQTGHMFYFEENKQFGISIDLEEKSPPLPFLPIWMGEGGADFASIAMMAKQNLNIDPFDQAVAKLDQARKAMEGSNSSFSLKDFESENTRINEEYFAYGGGAMSHIYLWNLNKDNFKKLMVEYYSIFAEKYRLNPESGWKDAFEDTFGITLESFYSDFDSFMRQDRDSQIDIIKSAEEWENASWN